MQRAHHRLCEHTGPRIPMATKANRPAVVSEMIHVKQ